MEIFIFGFLVLAPILYILLYRRSQMIKTAVLREYFHGKLSGVGTELAFTFAGANWRFVRIGKNRRSYPVVWCPLKTLPGKMCIGHEHSQPFAPFWVTKKHSTLINGICVAATEGRQMGQLVDLAKGPLGESLKRILDREFCHLTIDHEWHVQGWKIVKNSVVRFISVTEDVYESPQKLAETLNVLTEVVRALGLVCDLKR